MRYNFKIKKHRANDVAALLSNWENVEAAVKSASEAEGSAARENQKYVDSIQGRLDKLTTSWQSFANTFMSSDFLKGAVGALTSFVEGLEKVIDTVGSFPTLMGTVAAGFSLFKNKGFFKVETDKITGFATGITNIFSKAAKSVNDSLSKINIQNGFTKTLNEKDVAALRNYQNAISHGVSKTKALKQCMGEASGAAKDHAKNCQDGTKALSSFVSSQQQSAISLQAQNKSLGSANALIKEYYGGCKTTGMAQTDFANAVKSTNPALATAIASTNSAKGAMVKYTISTVGAKAATAALKVGVMALNATLTMFIGLLIDFAISGIMKVVNAKKDLAEKVDEITSKFKEQSNELKKLKGNYDTSNESSMISKYEKLSKGVDNLGRNVSLTAEEYSEYQSIVNSIADQIPSLVTGYDSQGNAILSCKGNVEELIAAYEKLIHIQNQEILTNTGDIEKDFANTVKDNNKQNWYLDWAGRGAIMAHFMDYDMTTDAARTLEDLLNSNDGERSKKIKNLDYQTKREIETALEGVGIDTGFGGVNLEKVLEETLKADSAKIKGIIDDFYGTFTDAVEEQKTIAQAKLSEAFDVSSAISGLNYGNISEELQDIAYQTVNSLDYNFFEELSKNGKTVEQWTTEMLNQLNAISKVDNKKIETGFELQTQFNGGEISYGEYIANLRDVEKTIDGLNLKDEVKEQLKISLNLDENSVVDQYDALVERLTSKDNGLGLGLDEKAVKKFLNSLSAEELAVATKIIPNLDAGTTIKEIQALIDEQLATEFTFDITVQTEGIEAFNTALTESRSAVGLTSESIAALKARYEDLEGFNAAALFEKTSNGIHLNNDELSRLEEQYVSVNKLNIENNLNKLVNKYNDLTEEIESCTDAQEKENLQLQAESYKDKIDELTTLASQYDGLTSSFAKWQAALEGAEEGDNYDSLYENLESIKELYDKGLVGTDKFKTAAQLMTNKDLSDASIDEIVNAYKKGYPKMQRYFTEGQKGCKNFLKDVQNLNSEWAHMNKDGSWDINFNVDEIAKKLGVSTDFVLQISKKLKDYGFEVNFEDTSFDNLKTKIEKTEAKLKELGKTPVDINVDIEANSENLGTIESEIEKAKTKISEINNGSVEPKVKTAQLEDAQAKLEALIDKKIEASQPSFMSLDASQVNASLVEALEKVKAYQEAINEANKLSELKEAGIVIDDSRLQKAREKVDECAKAIQGLDGEVKMAIGLEEDGSIDSIKKAFEEGKVKIDANTDPALTKIEQLAENVERIEDKNVVINVEVNGLDKVKELNKQIGLATDIDGDIDKLSKYVEGAKSLSDLGNNIASKVTADVEGNVIKTPEHEINNLKVFTDSAKDVHSIGHISSKVVADIEGNVFDNSERIIDNLKVYTDSAKDIKEFKGDISSKITADIDGSVFDNNEGTINNLEVFIESAKGIKEIEGNITSNITANTLGSVFTDKERSIDNLDVYIESAKGIRDIEGDIVSNITADVDGSVFTDSERTIDNLKVFIDSAKGVKDFEGDIISNITANTLGSVFADSERTTDNLKTFIESANGIKDIEGDIVSNITANTLGSVFTDKERSIDNLDVFIESAKGIRDIEGDITSNITANTLGSVFTDPEREIDNLEVFVESAKGIKDIEGDIVSNITANTLGSVFTDKEKSIDNLKVYIDSAKGIKEIEGNISSKVTADVEGNVFDKYETTIDNLGVFIKSAKGIKNLEGDTSSKVTANVYGNVLSAEDDKLSNLGAFADNANKLKGVGNFSSSVSANATGNAVEGEGVSSRLSSLTEFKSIVNGMTNQTVTVSVTAKVDSENVNAAIDLLKKVSDSGVFKDYSATVQVGAKIAKIDDAVVQNYKAPPKDGKVGYSVDPESSVFTWTAPKKDGVVNYSASVEALTDSQKHKRGTITYDVKLSGFPVVNGTANANGTAFANGTSGKAFRQGDWGVKKTTTALTGELGQELVVYKNRFWTVGDNGAEFATIPKGAIVFNHKQTAELFANGRVTSDGGRGKMLVNGTAFAEGTAFNNVTGGGSFLDTVVNKVKEVVNKVKETVKNVEKKVVEKNESESSLSTSNVDATGSFKEESSSSKPKSKVEDKFEETIDWIEIILDRAERAIDKYEKQANNVYKTWAKRNKALENEITEVGSTISLYEQAKNKYLSEANSVGLNESYASKVRNGSINIEDFEGESDEKLVEKIKNYQDLYNKYLDCVDKIDELKEQESSLYAQRFENVQSQYDSILQGYEHTETMLNEYISQAEEQGHIVSKRYYSALIDNEEDNIAKLKQEQASLIAERDKAVADGKIEKYSNAWYEQCEAIDSVTQAIEAGSTALIEYNNAMRDIDWEIFDLIQERISDITDESDFLIELMSNKKLFEDDGKLTSEGLATIGLHGLNYNTYMYESDNLAKEIADLDKQLAKSYDKNLEDRRRELVQDRYDAILAAEGEKDAIKDLVSEGIELELDALQELIDKKNEALESERDLYEYQKKVKEQTEEIASLEKQMAAFSGDDSEEARQKIQQIKVDLETARQDLEETEWDRYIQDTEKILTDLYDEYEQILNTRLDDINLLLEQVIDSINIAAGADGVLTSALGAEGALALAVSDNATSIGQTLKTETDKVGITLSNAMNNIWNTGGDNAKNVLTTYGSGFQKEQTTTNTELGDIRLAVNQLVSDSNKEAEEKIEEPKTKPASIEEPVKTDNNEKQVGNNNNNNNNGNKNITDNTLKGIAAAIWVYGSKAGWEDDPTRKNKLSAKLGAANAKKVQDYINKLGANGGLYKYWNSNNLRLDKYKYSAFKTGAKEIDETQLAWTQEGRKQEFIIRPSDGAILTPIAKGDSVLNASASNNIWDMANNPAEFIKNNLGIYDANVPSAQNVNNTYTQHIDNVVFRMDNVKNYDEILTSLSKDKNFDRLIEAMTLNKFAGKSSLAKGKAIRK